MTGCRSAGATVAKCVLVGFTAGVLVASAPAHAQGGTPFNERDDQYRLLGLKRAKQAFEIARETFAQQQKLREDGLLPESEYLAARQRLNETEVNYQQSLLAVLFEQQYVAVIEAVKFQATDDVRADSQRKRVRIRLENTSGGGAEFRHLAEVEDELFQALRPGIIHDVYVSLGNDDGAIISQPYEAKLEELRYGHPVDLTFELLQDVDTATVHLTYGHSAQRSVKVFLQKDATVDRLAVQSEQFAQEVELGSSATFALTLELFSGVSDTFKLLVVNLPPQINRYFIDPSSQARLSQFKFTEGGRTRAAALRVSLPDRASDAVIMDQPLPFYVLAVPRARLDAIRDDGKPMSEAAIAALGVGYVRLELVPRGVGELLVRLPQLYFSIAGGEAAEVTLELVNDGTRRLDNIEVTAEPPLAWEKSIEPSVLTALGVGEERKVSLLFRPPADIAPGKYEVRVRSSSYADDRPIQGEDKTISIEVRPEVRLALPAILAAVLVSLIVGLVWSGVRLARR